MKDQNIEAPVRLPYFDWDKAKHFYYVAKLGSVSEASRFLNLSQPSLSKKITILEDHLRCKLFVRTAKGLDLTRKGNELFAIIEKTFISLKGFSYSAAVTTSNGDKRKVSIATTHAVASYILNGYLAFYNRLHPEIVFELIAEDHFIDVILSDIDIAIRPYDQRTKEKIALKGVQKEFIFSTQKRLFASQEYLEKHGEPQTLADLKDHHLIAYAQPEKHPYADVSWILKLGMPEGELHEAIFTTNSVECMIKMAQEGLGIIASYEEYSLVKEAGLKNILPHVNDKLENYIFYPDYLKEDKKVIEIKDFLLNCFLPKAPFS